MATALKSLSDYDPAAVPDATGFTFGIVVSEYNTDITFALLHACVDTLYQHGAAEKDVKVISVPGTFELTSGAQLLHTSFNPSAIICLGCVIKGETDHDKYINHAVAQGITRLSLELEKPVIFGVLTPNTLQQAIDRAGGKHGNKGVEAAVAAIKMVALKRMLA
jgi:6,7-dimethyl-8-ribityllumazine synthase